MVQVTGEELPYIPLPKGTRVLDGRYIIVELLAQGNMGAVYRATHSELGKDVALKLMKPAFMNDAGLIERFKHEATIGYQLGHPGVVQVFDYGRDPNFGHVIAMELLNGVTLDDVLIAGTCSRTEMVKLLVQTLNALSAVHAAGVIHRDVKPANILLVQDADGTLRVKVGDFGIATGHDNARLTQTGMQMGTAMYMPPEQWLGGSSRALTVAADIFAVGAMLYEMCNGRDRTLPVQSLLMDVDVVQLPEERALTRPHNVDDELWGIIVKAIRRKPNERFPNAKEFARALTAWLRNHGEETDIGHVSITEAPESARAFTRATVRPSLRPSEIPSFQLDDPSHSTTAPVETTPPPFLPSRSRWPILVAAVGAVLLLVAGVMLTSSRQTTPPAPLLERVNAHSPRGATPPVTALALEPDAGVTPTPVVVATPPVELPAPPTEPAPVAETPSRASRRRGGHSRRHHREREASPPATTVVAATTLPTPTCRWETLADGTRRRVCH